MYYTIQEVSNLFKISTKTIRRWIDKGDLPIIKIGRAIRISQDEVDKIKTCGLKISSAHKNKVSSYYPKPGQRNRKERLSWVRRV